MGNETLSVGDFANILDEDMHQVGAEGCGEEGVRGLNYCFAS